MRKIRSGAIVGGDSDNGGGVRIARVFPRRTKATPDDGMAFTGPPGLFLTEVDEVHVSVTFTYDMRRAEELAYQWERVAPVTIGGPATGAAGVEFMPGKYVKKGYVITSRGCPNKCWFCSVWKREGHEIRELPITDGHNLLDDNLLACSDGHIRRVFAMLKRQKMQAEFTGGLEAARLRKWHCDLIADLNPKQMFFAYDTPDDYEPLVEAGRMLDSAGVTSRNKRRAYVLCGWPKDSTIEAELRMKQTWAAGFMPMAMLWRNKAGDREQKWKKWARMWSRPAIIKSMMQGAS